MRFSTREVLNNPRAVLAVTILQEPRHERRAVLGRPMMYARFSRCLMQVVQLLRLPGDSRCSRSLRRGGATALMQSGWDFDNVKQSGRWTSGSSTREYLHLCQTALARLHSSIAEERWRLFEVLTGGCIEALKALRRKELWERWGQLLAACAECDPAGGACAGSLCVLSRARGSENGQGNARNMV